MDIVVCVIPPQENDFDTHIILTIYFTIYTWYDAL